MITASERRKYATRITSGIKYFIVTFVSLESSAFLLITHSTIRKKEIEKNRGNTSCKLIQA
jgi:hypothetical protein